MEITDEVIKKMVDLGIDLRNEEEVYSYYKTQGGTYFISKEIAQRAIDEIVKPYIEENPEFVW